MRRLIHFILFTVFCFAAGRLSAQQAGASRQADTARHMIRISEDDDCINMWGNVSDNAYTNGTRIDYFYMPQRRPRSFIDKVLPHAGQGSLNTYGWGITQLMYTPDNLVSKDYQPDDYPYSGALFATHSLYSYDPDRKYSFQTELVLGVIGPAALTKPVQRLVHRWEGFDIPQGWDHQYPNDLLLNINVSAEKQLARTGSSIEIIGGARALAGTMQNSVAIYPLIRIGNMTPYFNGFFGQYSSTAVNGQGQRKGQFYFFVKPQVQLVFSNALLQGGVFTHNPNLPAGDENTKPPNRPADEVDAAATAPPLPYHAINTVVSSLTYGAVFTTGNFGLSFSQIVSSAEMKGLYCHQTGNVSVLVSW